MENLYLIVGLGNPGSGYSRTRHNVGFMVTDLLARRWQASWTSERKFHARLAAVQKGERRVLLLQPQTYMNASGDAVGAAKEFYRVALTRMLVVVDDADLPLGSLRLRPGGSSGGHHGLESIELRLGSRDYPRLRIGIGREDGAREIAGHVLGRFSLTETERLDKVLAAASDQAETWLENGIQKAMNQYNGAIDDPSNEGKTQ